jgi:hypothetical protein
MKNKLFALIFISFLSLSLTDISAGDCDTYYPLNKGTSWTYQQFDKKGKLTSTNTILVEDVIHRDSKTEFKIKATSNNENAKKDDVPAENTFSYICENNVLKIDISSLIPQETKDGFSGMEISIEQSEILIPPSLSVGQKLDDASIKMVVASSGMTIMTMNINITNRKVEKMEDVTTSAGSYNCALITYDMHTNMGFMKVQSSTKEWYSSQVGNVKSESYDKTGKLTNSQILSAYSK